MPNSKNGEPRVINNINIIINVGQNAELESAVSNASQLTTETIELETTAEVTIPAEIIADKNDENLLTENLTTAKVPVQSSTSQVDVFTTTANTDETTQAATDKTTFEFSNLTVSELTVTDSEGVGAANTIRQAASTQSVSSTLIPSSEIDSEAETSAITSIAPETSLPPPLGTTKEPENATFEPESSTTTASIIADVITQAESGGKSSDESAKIPEIQIDFDDFKEDTTKTPVQMQTNTEKLIFTSLNSVATPAWRLSTNTNTSTASINNIDERLEKVTNSTIGELNTTQASTIASLTSTAANSSKATEEIVNKTELLTAPEVFQTELFTALPTTAEATESPSAKTDATTEGERNGLMDTTATMSFSLGKDFRKTLVRNFRNF